VTAESAPCGMDSNSRMRYLPAMAHSFLRDLGIHAVHEYRDSLRSKRAIVVLLIYLGGSILLCNGFVSVLKELEDTVLNSLGVAKTESAGTVTQTLWKTDFFQRILNRMVKDPYLADHLVNVEPLAVYFFWMTSVFAPIILMMISPTRVSEELATGSARFVLFRSSHATWILGKVAGQLFLLYPALLCCAAGAWLVGWFRLSHFDGAGTAAQLLQYSLLLAAYLTPFLFAATGVSQLTRSVNLATCYGFVFIIASAALHGMSIHYRNKETWTAFWQFIAWILPQGYRKDLLYPDPSHLVPAILILFCLGVAYLLPGYRLLTRRDV
jgi:ABC-type transport system involved in multi-copper enzyme maturation permease subunit